MQIIKRNSVKNKHTNQTIKHNNHIKNKAQSMGSPQWSTILSHVCGITTIIFQGRDGREWCGRKRQGILVFYQ